MIHNYKLYLSTFFGVLLTIFIIGFIGLNISLKFIQEKYIQLQLDVNKRQAEQTRHFLMSQIKNGNSLDSIQNQFQSAIAGTESDKGFMCIYDTKKDQLVCHPNKNAIGYKFNDQFVFKSNLSDEGNSMTNIYKQKKPAGGIFKQADLRIDIVYTIPIEGTNWFLNVHENINAISNEIELIRSQYNYGSLILGLLIAISVTITSRKISNKYEKEIEQKNIVLDSNYNELKILHEQLSNQKIEIEKQRDFVQLQRDEISLQNKQIHDSINYAKRLQYAILPRVDSIEKEFPNYFVIHKPKDIVSGDFYWIEKIDNLFFVAVADSTGHGVPGALVSVVCYSALNRAVKEFKLTDTGKILDKTRELIIETFVKSSEDVKDGMDISLLCIDKQNKVVYWSGANNPLWLVNNNELVEIKADKQPVGKSFYSKPFTCNKLNFKSNTTYYLFTDGFADQFGGPNGKKFKYKQFEELLISINNETMLDQSSYIDKKFEEWKGTHEQVDDVCLIGIKI